MSVGRPNGQLTLTNEDEYFANEARIEEAQAAIDRYKAMNDAAKKAYDKKMELRRIVEAGKEAERQLFELSGGSSSGQLAISGPSEPTPSTSYGGAWQSAVQVGGHQKHHTNMSTNNFSNPNNVPQWQAYQNSSFIHYQPQGSQPTVPVTRPGSVSGVQSHEQFVSHQFPANKRMVSNTARQQMPTAQQRQPLAMQPVTQQSLRSGSYQTRAQVPAGPSGTSYGGDHYGVAVPNHTTAKSQQTQFSHLPGNSSASGSRNNAPVHHSTPSDYTLPADTPSIRSTTPSTLSDTVKRLEAQIKALNTASGQSVPSNEALSATNLSSHYQNLANNLAQAEWLETLVENWQSTAAPKSLMSLPNSTIKVCKTTDSMVYLVHTDPQTKKTDMFPFSLFKEMKKSASLRAVNGSVQQPNVPSDHTTQSSSTKIRTPDLEMSTPPARARTLLTSVSSPTRSPKHADRRRLAKDILRALKPSPAKQLPHDGPSQRPSSLIGQGSSSENPRHLVLPLSNNQEQESSNENPVHPVPPIFSKQPTAIEEGTEPLPTSTQETIEKSGGTFSMSDNSAASSVSFRSHYRPHLDQPPGGADVGSNFYQPGSNNLALPSIFYVPQADNAKSAEKVSETPALPSVAPQTAAPNTPQQKTPLFLPSSPASPALSAVDGLERTGSPRLSPPFYVLIPPLPDYVKKYKAQQLNRKRRRISTLAEDGLSVIEIGSSDKSEGEDVGSIDVSPACSGFVNDESERQAVLLSCSRVSERLCKWNGCQVTLGSAEKLIQHLAYQHEQRSTPGGLCVCRWQQCGRHGRNMKEFFQHVKNHAILPLRCAYQDCQESFRTPRQLTNHHRGMHSNDELKPSAAPFRPTTSVPPGPVPQIVPSYLAEPVYKAVMLKERHTRLESLVWRKIAGPVSEGITPYNAASKRPRTSGEDERRVGNQPYDFLTHPSVNLSTRPSQPAKLRDIEDVNSGEISEIACHEMLVLWPGPDDEVEEADGIEQLATPTTGVKLEGVDVELADEIAPSDRSHDEQAVETMLSNVIE